MYVCVHGCGFVCVYERVRVCMYVLVSILLSPCIGLKLQGAKCSKNTLELTATILTELPLTTLEWVR